MPVRNGERWLAEACRSVLAQTLADIELIIVDDGSDDGTPGLAKAFAAADARVRHATQPPHGLVAALNLGLRMAAAPLIARLDADDIALPDRLARQVAFLAANPGTLLLGTWADTIDEGGNRIGRLKPETAPHRLAEILIERNPFIHSTVMLRAASVRGVGGYRSSCEASEDYDLWLRLAEHGEVAILPDVLGCYRRQSDAVSLRRAVRQAFSARLARRAARMRRDTLEDPLAGIEEAPDWWADAALSQFFADDARLTRFLSIAEPDGVQPERLALVSAPSAAMVRQMTHAERRLARRAIGQLLRIDQRPPHLGIFRLGGIMCALTVGRMF
jgi:glycosyltransferase involved in cell wall biosynthesis